MPIARRETMRERDERILAETSRLCNTETRQRIVNALAEFNAELNAEQSGAESNTETAILTKSTEQKNATERRAEQTHSNSKKRERNLMLNLICGIELEITYNREILGNIRTGNYHGDGRINFGKTFISESDGSLSTGRDNWATAELVSKPFLWRDYKKVITSFYNTLYVRISKRHNITIAEAKKSYPLKDIVEFNTTTGTHIHLSLLNAKPQTATDSKSGATANAQHKTEKTAINFRETHKPFNFDGKLSQNFINNLNLEFLKSFNDALIERVKKELPKVADSWTAQFYRRFANPLDARNLFISRSQSWNLTNQRQGLEFRSFNLVGVKSWRDFFKIFDITFKLLKEHFIKNAIKSKGKLFAEQLKRTIKLTQQTENTEQTETLILTIEQSKETEADADGNFVVFNINNDNDSDADSNAEQNSDTDGNFNIGNELRRLVTERNNRQNAENN